MRVLNAQIPHDRITIYKRSLPSMSLSASSIPHYYYVRPLAHDRNWILRAHTMRDNSNLNVTRRLPKRQRQWLRMTWTVHFIEIHRWIKNKIQLYQTPLILLELPPFAGRACMRHKKSKCFSKNELSKVSYTRYRKFCTLLIKHIQRAYDREQVHKTCCLQQQKIVVCNLQFSLGAKKYTYSDIITEYPKELLSI